MENKIFYSYSIPDTERIAKFISEKLISAKIKKKNPSKAFEIVKHLRIISKFFREILGIKLNAAGTNKKATVLSNPVLVRFWLTDQNKVKKNIKYISTGKKSEKSKLILFLFNIKYYYYR